MTAEPAGSLIWISGPVVRARLRSGLTMTEQVWVGRDRLAGEVIELGRDVATIQVYEETSGLKVGEPVVGTGRALTALLGPGLLGGTFDGIQRPLETLRERTGIYIRRGEAPSALDPEESWGFEPRVEEGDRVEAGAVLGVVQETPVLEHRVLVPPGVEGTLESLADEGDYGVEDEIGVVRGDDGEEHPLTLSHRWPVRRARPTRRRLPAVLPLVTGQRVVDSFFPVVLGGTASVPGPFGSGKTVLQHSLAKWADADVIVYVGCGERGNEMVQVLEEFPELEDPRTGRSLTERTILIANTSNMPVAARESSIYTGITLAEYFRDQGYAVALIADSTSRWAEALREISGRLEEMPAEEGFPAYLPSRLAAFYERAGRMETLSGEEGSVTVVGAVSPPGGDFSEPVTRHTRRHTRCFWALDRELANERHYPAVDWLTSYSLYLESVEDWWRDEVGVEWAELRGRALELLEKESDLEQIVQLVGPEAVSEEDRWVLDTARLLREGFLQQNAFHPVDAYTPPGKQAGLLQLYLGLHRLGAELLEEGVPLSEIRDTLDVPRLIQLGEEIPNDEPDRIEEVRSEVEEALEGLRGSGE